MGLDDCVLATIILIVDELWFYNIFNTLSNLFWMLFSIQLFLDNEYSSLHTLDEIATDYILFCLHWLWFYYFGYNILETVYCNWIHLLVLECGTILMQFWVDFFKLIRWTSSSPFSWCNQRRSDSKEGSVTFHVTIEMLKRISY